MRKHASSNLVQGIKVGFALKNIMNELENFCEKYQIENPKSLDFSKIKIDSKIKNIIKKINLSDWICTIYSCQGHFEKDSYISPYISFIIKNEMVKDFLFLIYNTVPKNKQDSGRLFLAGANRIEIVPELIDEHFTVITVYWSKSCIDNQEFYNLLKRFSNLI